MSTDISSLVSLNAEYNYSYTKNTEIAKDDTAEGKTVQTVSKTTSKQQPSLDAKLEQMYDDKKIGQYSADGNDVEAKVDGKTAYEEYLEEEKDKQEAKKKEEEEARRQEYIKEVERELNKNIQNINDQIKLDINNKVDAVTASVLSKSTQEEIKKLSKDELDMLIRRLNYVMGVLLDSKG